jgi:FHA domain
MAADEDDSKTTFFVQHNKDLTKFQSARLFMIKGPLTGASIPLHAESTIIGRLADNDIVIQSSSVSKTHCEITNDRGERYLIVDLGSTNGTKVNGRILKPGIEMLLAHGDTITLCENSCFFLLSGGKHKDKRCEEISIDLGAALKEADELLNWCSEFAEMRKSRRKKSNTSAT